MEVITIKFTGICGSTTLRNIHDFMHNNTVSHNHGNSGILSDCASCIKSCINNSHKKSHETFILAFVTF